MLIHQYGSLGGILENSKELLVENGLSEAKAYRLSVMLEIQKRVLKEFRDSPVMNSAQAIYDVMAPRLANEKIEYVCVILLDSKLRATRIIEVSKGNDSTALCEVKDVLHHVLVNNAKAFIVVHNHPSGDPAPSRQDLTLTKRIAESSEVMRLRFVDHVIVGRQSRDFKSPYYSFCGNGVI